ncbi:peptidoglycan-binding protein [Candidatus Uhrbacteria bacterium]|nr:peptidoglycan-binding protein [Candidatus Uhrbacteria bacterium]
MLKQNLFSQVRLFMAMATASFGLVMASAAQAGTPVIYSAKITAPDTVTLVFSEPVNIDVNKFSSLTGDLSGHSISSLSGAGTSAVVLTLTGSPLGPSTSGSLGIANTTVSVSDSSPFNNALVQVSDGQVPALSSINISSNNVNNGLAKVGTLISLSFSTNESVNVNSVSMAGHTVPFSGSGTGPFTAAYTLVSGDTEGQVPVTINLVDFSSNSVIYSLALATGATAALPAVASGPTINSITSTASSSSTLRVGDQIIFTLTPTNPVAGGVVTSSYNGVSLNWSSSNSGITYTAVYSIYSGHNDQSSPLQISGVTITDSTGRISPAGAGSDVRVGIDGHPPVLNELTAMPLLVSTKTPSYSFSSTEAGNISYGGDCMGTSASASVGSNMITFNLSEGTHYGCTVAVTDLVGNTSNRLSLPSFTVNTSSGSSTVVPPAASTSTTPTVTTPVSSKFVFTKLLRLGDNNNDVKELQKKLKTLGFFKEDVTGRFGALTQKYLKEFQVKNKLDAFGYVGPGTRTLLNK